MRAALIALFLTLHLFWLGSWDIRFGTSVGAGSGGVPAVDQVGLVARVRW